MALTVRKTSECVEYALAAAFNAFKKDVATNLTTLPHADITSTTSGDFSAPASSPYVVTADNGDGTIAVLRTLCLDLYNVYLAHLADTQAHKVADTAPALVLPTSSSSLSALETFVNAVQTDYNTHRASTTYHYTADTTNVSSAATADDQAKSDTLANDLKTQINAHVQAGFTSPSLNLIGA